MREVVAIGEMSDGKWKVGLFGGFSGGSISSEYLVVRRMSRYDYYIDIYCSEKNYYAIPICLKPIYSFATV